MAAQIATVEAAGNTAVLAGLLWIQGESDAKELNSALAYGENLAAMISELRFDLDAPDLPVVVAELATEDIYTYAALVRNAQVTVAQSLPNVDVIDSDDMPLQADARHYTVAAAETVALRFLDSLSGIGSDADRPRPDLVRREGSDLRDSFTGNDSPEAFILRAGNDTVDGGAGDDMIYGQAGHDLLRGGDGDDLIDGGDGNDRIDGGDGDDMVKGRLGSDRIDGGHGNDWIMGGLGRDAIRGGAGFDTASYADLDHAMVVGLDRGFSDGPNGDRLVSIEAIQGTGHNDVIVGDTGRNFLYGEAGDDTLMGGAGPDRLFGGPGADRLDGGANFDWAQYNLSRSAVTVDLALGTGHRGDAEGDTLVSIEGIVGSRFDDILVGGAGNDRLHGYHGDDTLDGGAGDDLLCGSLGADVFVFSPGHDRVLDFETGVDRIDLRGAAFVDLSIDSVEGQTLLTLGVHTMLLVGVPPTGLSQEDFLP